MTAMLHKVDRAKGRSKTGMIEVVECDITTQAVALIINAADPGLRGGGEWMAQYTMLRVRPCAALVSSLRRARRGSMKPARSLAGTWSL
jgi:hypothetical protein